MSKYFSSYTGEQIDKSVADSLTAVQKSSIVTTVSSASTNAQIPSAKLFYDTVGDIESLLEAML